jgi:hypothetical protein
VNLESGKTIEAEMYIQGSTIGVNTGFMPPASLDSKGFIKVDKKFKVEVS